ncbi:MAG: sigma factor regulator FecR [Candidatus Omnitrophica bacterium]|nr:sigma factor regulator FecR [Candidatus Omnitrophota bacterium]
MDSSIQKLARLIFQSQQIIIFTGAGISTESGISDYRSKGGLWQRFQPVTIQDFITSEEKRVEYWLHKRELYESFTSCKPNDGHYFIKFLEDQKKLKGIITQNIDGLHAQAGNDPNKILELHGTNRETLCLTCQDVTSWGESFARLQAGEAVLFCRKCQGLLKPNTVSFGQNLNQEVLQKAYQWSRESDLFIVLGSTLVVEPAATLPRLAKQSGAKLVILTLSGTPLDAFADMFIQQPIGETLNKVKELLLSESSIPGGSIHE